MHFPPKTSCQSCMEPILRWIAGCPWSIHSGCSSHQLHDAYLFNPLKQSTINSGSKYLSPSAAYLPNMSGTDLKLVSKSFHAQLEPIPNSGQGSRATGRNDLKTKNFWTFRTFSDDLVHFRLLGRFLSVLDSCDALPSFWTVLERWGPWVWFSKNKIGNDQRSWYSRCREDSYMEAPL